MPSTPRDELQRRITGLQHRLASQQIEVALIGQNIDPVEPTRLGFRHIVLRRDIQALPRYVERGILTWSDIFKTYQGSLEFFDFDPHDIRPTVATLMGCFRAVVGTVLRAVGLRRKLD